MSSDTIQKVVQSILILFISRIKILHAGRNLTRSRTRKVTVLLGIILMQFRAVVEFRVHDVCGCFGIVADQRMGVSEIKIIISSFTIRMKGHRGAKLSVNLCCLLFLTILIMMKSIRHIHQQSNSNKIDLSGFHKND